MKAHIAHDQNAGRPTVLCWNLSTADRGKLDGMAPAFGMRVVPVPPEEAEKTVAQLLAQATPSGSAPKTLSPQNALLAPTPAALFADFPERDLDTLLDLLKQAQVNIPLKAAATRTNRAWPFAELLRQLAKERAAYAALEKK